MSNESIDITQTGLKVVGGPRTLDQLYVRYWKLLVYGLGGSGKTVLSATSGDFKTFMFDVDEGAIAADAYMTRNRISKKNVTVWPVPTLAEFNRAYDYLAKNQDKYNLATLDTATELQRIIMREVLAANGRSVPQIQDWGVVLTIMEDIAVKFRHKIKMHVMWTAHEMVRSDAQDGADFYRPSFQGAFKYEYMKHFSVVGRMIAVTKEEKGKEKKRVHAICFGPSNDYHFKDRSGVLEEFEHPGVDSLFGKLIGATSKPPEEEDSLDYDEMVLQAEQEEVVDNGDIDTKEQ